jgi:hypothetical protein
MCAGTRTEDGVVSAQRRRQTVPGKWALTLHCFECTAPRGGCPPGVLVWVCSARFRPFFRNPTLVPFVSKSMSNWALAPP